MVKRIMKLQLEVNVDGDNILDLLANIKEKEMELGFAINKLESAITGGYEKIHGEKDEPTE